ncbi:hypothetical protein IPdc08_00772 [archaeon]|nr:hypothetical protein IPdc08_00772 [archaeon]
MIDEEKIINALKEIIDPHTGTSVYEMGLIRDLKVEEDYISLTFVPSSPFCPLGVQLSMQIKEKLQTLGDIGKINIKVEGHIQEKELNEMLSK